MRERWAVSGLWAVRGGTQRTRSGRGGRTESQVPLRELGPPRASRWFRFRRRLSGSGAFGGARAGGRGSGKEVEGTRPRSVLARGGVAVCVVLKLMIFKNFY